MKVEFIFSNDSKNELKNIIKETIKEELGSILSIKESTPEPKDLFLTRKDTCELLGCSPTTLYHYQKKGLIPFRKIGRKVLFNKEDVLKHLKINIPTF